MRKKPLIWHLFPLNLTVVVLSLVTIGFFMIRLFREHLVMQRASFVEQSLKVFEGKMPRSEDAEFDEIDALCKAFGENSHLRFTVLSAVGEVLGDSHDEPTWMESEVRREDVQAALQGRRFSVRYVDPELQRKLLVVTRPWRQGEEVRGVLRATMFLGPQEERGPQLWFQLIAGGIFIAVCAGILSWLVSRRIAKPIEEIRQGAEQLAKGQFKTRLAIPATLELANLADAFNQMAARLEQIDTLRQEFVGNVSHELKTPMTSIRGFVETLIERPPRDPKEAQRFLDFIRKDVERLDGIVNDLMTLSRIEGELEKTGLERSAVGAGELMHAAVDACRGPAAERSVPVHIEADQRLTVVCNRRLLEQAIVNLINNAVAFSEPGHVVQVRAHAEGEGARIEVEDQGCGISQEHLSRVFERFYRVDKGRSRKQGGTGLGLAVVKHIVQVHGGSVGVESVIGKGSRFWIQLPGQSR